MDAFELDERCKANVFWLLVDMIDRGVITTSQVKKPLYLEEYYRYKGVNQ